MTDLVGLPRRSPGAAEERDHYVEQPTDGVAGCSDRGLEHPRNEDAIAVAARAGPDPSAVLVVCDGVSTSENSDVASRVAARAARDLLVAEGVARLGALPLGVGALEQAVRAATEAANSAVLASTTAQSAHPASCTLSVVVVQDDLVVFGNVGDSRSYWLPDPGSIDQPRQLSVDDSVAQLRVEMGASRADAEAAPQAHAITKWLGQLSEDHSPTVGALTVAVPGWVLVCSDGLWNYCSAAADLQRLVAERSVAGTGARELCESLVGWANEQGGRDNVSVALARYQP